MYREYWCIFNYAMVSLYYKVYKNKSSENAVEFLKKCKEFFPFYLTHILTDNGLEFTDKWARGKGFVSGNHKFDVAVLR